MFSSSRRIYVSDSTFDVQGSMFDVYILPSLDGRGLRVGAFILLLFVRTDEISFRLVGVCNRSIRRSDLFACVCLNYTKGITGHCNIFLRIN